jgi:hypothetical protein
MNPVVCRQILKRNILTRIYHEVIVSKHQLFYRETFSTENLITNIYFIDRNTVGNKKKIFTSSSYFEPITNKNDFISWYNNERYNHITFNVPGRFLVEVEDNGIKDEITNKTHLNSLNRFLPIVVDVVYNIPI